LSTSEIEMLDKSFPFFKQYPFFLSLSVSHHFLPLFPKKRGFLRSKSLILVENRQIEFFFLEMKSLTTLDAF